LTKVPSVNYPQIIAAFERIGWQVVRQRGSHIRLQKRTERGTQKITVPAHKPVKRSTLAKILKDAEIEVDAFIALLR
jgi:predicted RNA binding protein YcfA (HicA-like mRNA interferase family)